MFFPWYQVMTLGLQQSSCTGAPRGHRPAVEARRHRRSLVKDQTCYLCYCWSGLLLVRHFAHLPMIGGTRGYSGLRPHPNFARHVSVHTAPSRENIDAERPYPTCSTWRSSRKSIPLYRALGIRRQNMCVHVTSGILEE